jgi:N-formylglutamate deformylase
VFAIMNCDGGGRLTYRVIAGGPASPVILHVPHASRELTPFARRGIVLGDAALAAELDLMTDAHTDLIATRAAAQAALGPWIFVNQYSRLVVDPERFPDEREEMRAAGMGAVYTRTSHGQPLRADDPGHAEALLGRHFRPYAEAFADLVDERLHAAGRALILDVHSYPSTPLPYEMHADDPRPAVCLGTDAFHTPAALLDAARSTFASVGTLAVDSPFAGCYVPLRHYRRDARVAALMVELRRDTYMTEPGGAPNEGINAIVRALSALLHLGSGGKAFWRKGFSGDH